MMICSHFVAEGDEVQGDQKVGDSLNVLHTHTCGDENKSVFLSSFPSQPSI